MSGTDGLKALARRRFTRDSQRDKPGTNAETDCPTPADGVGQASEAKAHASEVDDAGHCHAFEERAAIVEYDGGAPREWAEGFAYLDRSQPVPAFGSDRWQQLIDDGGRFLDRWAATAFDLGWTGVDVFGVDPSAPAARYDNRGLVTLIRGGEVIDIRADRATIQMPGGSCLTYYLRRPGTGAVTLWDLTR